MLCTALQGLHILLQTHPGSQWDTSSSDACLKAALWMATYTPEGNSDLIYLVSWRNHTTLQDIHAYTTAKCILFKMQIVPMSNFNLVSAEPNYQDLTQAYFALVLLSGGPMLTVKWCATYFFCQGDWEKLIAGVCFDHRTCWKASVTKPSLFNNWLLLWVFRT